MRHVLLFVNHCLMICFIFFGTVSGSILVPMLAHLWYPFGVTFGALWMHFSCPKKDWGAKGAPRGALGRHHQNKVSYLDPFWRSFLTNCGVSDAKRCVLETGRSFSSILGRFERSRGWAHMRSVRARAVKTHFSVFVLVRKKGSLKTLKQVQFEVIFG